MKKQSGFTLIELVVVIVILGILAVTAAPKFLNLQDDAKISALKGLSGGIKGAMGITYGKAAVSGVERKKPGKIMVDGSPVILNYGYPTANENSLGRVVDGLYSDWKENPTTNVDTSGVDTYFGYDNFDCVVGYTAAKSASQAASVQILGTEDGCLANIN